jgi:hypothetical protein
MVAKSGGLRERAGTSKLRVMNTAEGTLITPDVVLIDPRRETFTAVAQKLKDIASSGVWLNPYTGIPKLDWVPELDIVYLDEQFQVLRCIESYKQGLMSLPETSACTAVVLPSGRLSAARVRFGDQLEIRDAATGVLWERPVTKSEDAVADGSVRSHGLVHQHAVQGKGLKGIFSWLFQGQKEEPKQEEARDRRKGERHAIPGAVAYFSIGNPRGNEVSNISTEGFYVRTADRWLPGTSLLAGLEIINPASHEIEAKISVQSKVVRIGSDGVGFAYDDEPEHHNFHLGARNPEQLAHLQKFLLLIKRS